MTEARVSRVAAEALVQDPAPEARVSRVAAEALVQDPAPDARVSRFAVEALISVAGAAAVRRGGWGIPIA